MKTETLYGDTVYDSGAAVLRVCLCEPIGAAVMTSLGEVRFCDKHGGAIPISDLVRKRLCMTLYHTNESGEIVPLIVEREQP